MTKIKRPGPPLIADAFALDFLNSTAAPTGTAFDWLGDGADLLSWLELTRMIPRDVATEFRNGDHQPAIDKTAALARELREWFRHYIAINAGKPQATGSPKDLAPLNRILARDQCFHQIAHNTDGTLHLQSHRHFRTPKDLLIPIAEAMADFICEANFERVKNCEGSACTLWFHDVSKSHKRRWCDMSVCGNRAKAAAHRAKIRAK